MAADSLIDRYVRAFAAQVRARRDCADLVDEVEDHLRTSAERLEALGIDRETAERRALARFGEPRLVAALITAIPSKGSTVSLFFSRHLAGVAAVAAALWIAAAIAAYFGMADVVPGWIPQYYYLGAGLIALACLATTCSLIGLNLRASGVFDGSTAGVMALGIAATVASSLAWFVGLWMPLLIAAVLWTLVRAWATHAVSRPFTIVMFVLLPVLALAAIVASAIAVTGTVSTGLLSWALFAGVAAVITAGLVDLAIRIGRRAGSTEALA